MSQEYDLKRCLRKEADLCYFCVKTTKLEKLLIFIKILFTSSQVYLQSFNNIYHMVLLGTI